MTTVQVIKAGQTLTCHTPYHPDFPIAAKDIGGKWNGKSWVFDARDESRVRDLCLDLFGTDGSPCEMVTMRVVLAPAVMDRISKDTEIYIAGRRCAWVFGHADTRARLGDGVVLLSGRVHGIGSRKRPSIGWESGTTVEVRDVPLTMAQNVQCSAPELVALLSSPASARCEAMESVTRHARALIDERYALLKRLAEIDSALLDAVPGKRDLVFGVSNDLLDND